MVLLFDELKGLQEMRPSDATLLDHVQSALKNRLKVFKARRFDFDPSKPSTNGHLACLTDYTEEPCPCPPPH